MSGIGRHNLAVLLCTLLAAVGCSTGGDSRSVDRDALPIIATLNCEATAEYQSVWSSYRFTSRPAVSRLHVVGPGGQAEAAPSNPPSIQAEKESPVTVVVLQSGARAGAEESRLAAGRTEVDVLIGDTDRAAATGSSTARADVGGTDSSAAAGQSTRDVRRASTEASAAAAQADTQVSAADVQVDTPPSDTVTQGQAVEQNAAQAGDASARSDSAAQAGDARVDAARGGARASAAQSSSERTSARGASAVTARRGVSDAAATIGQAELTLVSAYAEVAPVQATLESRALRPLVSVELRPDRTRLLAGDQVGFTVVVRNTGPLRVEGVEVVQPLPDGLDLVGVSGVRLVRRPSEHDARAVVALPVSLSPGASYRYRLTARVASSPDGAGP